MANTYWIRAADRELSASQNVQALRHAGFEVVMHENIASHNNPFGFREFSVRHPASPVRPVSVSLEEMAKPYAAVADSLRRQLMLAESVVPLKPKDPRIAHRIEINDGDLTATRLWRERFEFVSVRRSIPPGDFVASITYDLEPVAYELPHFQPRHEYEPMFEGEIGRMGPWRIVADRWPQEA